MKVKVFAKNKKAYHDYHILEELEAGMVLMGPEVKSIRQNKASIKGAFCKFVKDELWLFDANISQYEFKDLFSKIEEKRPRKLLLSRKQLNKWMGKMAKEQHLTIVPLELYLNDSNIFKISVALVKGKTLYDKRESDKVKTQVMKKAKEMSDY
jgi:SsrA-binding protein